MQSSTDVEIVEGFNNCISIKPIPWKFFKTFHSSVSVYGILSSGTSSLFWIFGIDKMFAQTRGSGMCFSMCHKSAFALGFIGKCGQACVVAFIFKSVFRRALSGEVVPF